MASETQKKLESAIALYEEVLEKSTNEIKRLEAELEKELEGRKVVEVEQLDGKDLPFIMKDVKFASSKKDLLEMQLKVTTKQKERVALTLADLEHKLFVHSVTEIMQKATEVLGGTKQERSLDGIGGLLDDMFQDEELE